MKSLEDLFEALEPWKKYVEEKDEGALPSMEDIIKCVYDLLKYDFDDPEMLVEIVGFLGTVCEEIINPKIRAIKKEVFFKTVAEYWKRYYTLSLAFSKYFARMNSFLKEEEEVEIFGKMERCREVQEVCWCVFRTCVFVNVVNLEDHISASKSVNTYLHQHIVQMVNLDHEGYMVDKETVRLCVQMFRRMSVCGVDYFADLVNAIKIQCRDYFNRVTANSRRNKSVPDFLCHYERVCQRERVCMETYLQSDVSLFLNECLFAPYTPFLLTDENACWRSLLTRDVLWRDGQLGKLISIKVDAEFEVRNGLKGMLRDLLLRLSVLMCSRDSNVRCIIGMYTDSYGWRKHSYFINSRPEIVPVTFRSNSQIDKLLSPAPTDTNINTNTNTNTNPATMKTSTGGCAGVVQPPHAHAPSTHDGPQWSFCSDNLHTVFLSKLITEGIFHVTVRVDYYAYLSVGAAERDGLDGRRRASGLGDFGLGRFDFNYFPRYSEAYDILRNKGACSLCIEEFRALRTYQFLYARDAPTDIPTLVPHNSFLSMEIDARAHTLSFFVDGRKIPQAVSAVPVRVYLGISGEKCCLTTVSFRRLAVPTLFFPPVVCKYYEFIPK